MHVNTLQRSSFLLHKDAVWRKWRSSPLALLLPINLLACAFWLNDFVQTKCNLDPALQAVRVGRAGNKWRIISTKGRNFFCVLYAHMVYVKRGRKGNLRSKCLVVKCRGITQLFAFLSRKYLCCRKNNGKKSDSICCHFLHCITLILLCTFK